ncbi:MAG: type II toxin-antitoxin system PemK/MazF family toxin [Chloroflexia bacterium]|nr:type II toxin-antitoxin system PemK/MazF family toxin [Chloroflexia bacterium]
MHDRHDPQVGTGQAGRRPALVISSDDFNRTPNGHLLLVVPIRRRARIR